jgi:DNA gyrase subunit B/topoisomerase-4 subunit B
MTKNTYSAKDVEVLEGLEGCRRRPAMYIGATDSNGIFQITKEVADNASDEALAGRNSYVGIHIDGDTIHVADKGGGIPVEKHPKTGVSTLTEILTKLHAGGKFGSKAYAGGSKGVHGVGVSVTNALSSKFVVHTNRNGQWYRQSFSEGKPKSKVEKVAKVKFANTSWKRGTIVSFVPDAKIFKAKSKLPIDLVSNYIEMQSYLHPGVTFYLNNNGKEISYHHKDGIIALLEKRIKELKTEKLTKKIFSISNKGVNCVFCWTELDEEMTFSYVNGSLTKDGGTHVKGLYDAINEAIKPFKGAKKFSAEDLRSGLLAIINIAIAEPEFSSQTKEKLIKAGVAEQVYNTLLPAVKKFFNENKSFAKLICKRAAEFNKLKADFVANKRAAAAIKSKKHKAQLPAKLSGSTTKNPDERELFLVEGDSASGSVINARDPKFQEVLSLRGKVINAYGKSSNKLFQNKEVLDILRAIGYDPSKPANSQKFRVGKVIILTDPDVDGKHINLLLLSIFQRICPKLIEQKKLYVVDSPLYNTQWKGKRYFGKSYKDVIRQLPKGAKPTDGVQRIKGWGEVGNAVIETVATDKKQRKLTLVKPINSKKLKRYISIVGDNPAARKELLGV